MNAHLLFKEGNKRLRRWNKGRKTARKKKKKTATFFCLGLVSEIQKLAMVPGVGDAEANPLPTSPPYLSAVLYIAL